MALTPNLDNGREVYRVCATCHGGEGWGETDGSFPQLAGQHRSTLIKQLDDIRSLNRDNPIMYPFALTEVIGGVQALADVTGYIARLPMSPAHGRGDWRETSEQFQRGRQRYLQECADCHGEQGEGSDAAFFPRLQGQHYRYLMRQLIWIRDGRRRNANPEMSKRISAYSDTDLAEVANYISRLPLPVADLAPSANWRNPDFD